MAGQVETRATMRKRVSSGFPLLLRRSQVHRVISQLVRSYVVRRVLKAIFTIWLVATMTFFLIRLMPGSPVDVYIHTLISQYGFTYDEAANQAAALFAFDPKQPLVAQYVDYLRSLARGDLGQSLVSPGTPVSAVIAKYLPWTLFSAGLGLLLSFLFGLFLGMIMAYRRGGVLDHLLTALGSFFQSVPNYLVAIVLLVFFGVQLGWLPITKMRGALSPGVQPGFTFTFLADVLYHAALPIVTYVLTTVGSWMLLMKSSTLSTLEEDYVMVARARGLPDSRIMRAYVGRNAVLPLFAQMAIAAGFVVGGSVVIERIFVYEGIGFILLDAINRRDYPVMQGIFLVITVAVVFANLLADLLYSRLDPRIRVHGREEEG